MSKKKNTTDELDSDYYGSNDPKLDDDYDEWDNKVNDRKNIKLGPKNPTEWNKYIIEPEERDNFDIGSCYKILKHSFILFSMGLIQIIGIIFIIGFFCQNWYTKEQIDYFASNKMKFVAFNWFGTQYYLANTSIHWDIAFYFSIALILVLYCFMITSSIYAIKNSFNVCKNTAAILAWFGLIFTIIPIGIVGGSIYLAVTLKKLKVCNRYRN